MNELMIGVLVVSAFLVIVYLIINKERIRN